MPPRLVQPLAQSPDEFLGVLWFRRAVVTDANHVRTELTRNDVVGHLEAFQYESIHFLQVSRIVLVWNARLEAIQQFQIRLYDVVDFGAEVALRWWKLELPVDKIAHLLLRQRVTLNRCRTVCALHEKDGEEVPRRFGLHRDFRDVLDLRRALTEHHP